MSILAAGGTGYIGSYMVKDLTENGEDVVVADNLLTGHRDVINPKTKFYGGDIRDRQFLDKIFDNEDITIVVHLAAFLIVPEPTNKPLKYFDSNTGGMITLSEVMYDHDIKYIVFSSTTVTYGVPEHMSIKEADPQNLVNPYGLGKLVMEGMMAWADKAYGIKFVALRYFNVAGVTPDGTIGGDHGPKMHLVSITLRITQGKRDELNIFGDDCNTSDGINVCDYVRAVDLADAHVLAIKHLKEGGKSNASNPGSSTGFSNKQMLEAAQEVIGKPISAKMASRRPGDPDSLVAASDKVYSVLGWSPKYNDVHDIIATAWEWHSTHPKGYDDRD